MARGKRKNTIIKVKSAPSNSSVVDNLVKPSKVVSKHIFEPEKTSVAVKSATNYAEKPTGHINVSSTIATDATQVGTRHIAPRRSNKKKRIDDAFIEVELKVAGPKDTDARPDFQIDGATDEKERKNEKYKNKDETIDAEKEDVEIKTPRISESIKKQEPAPKIRTINPSGCFGFVSTWFAKRKERRREKKRKAIQRRSVKSVESLVVYGQKSARGGVTFTVELDSRPMRKPKFPSTRQHPGHIRLCSKQKMERAENNRAGHISERIRAAEAHDLHVMKVGIARAQNEYFFKLKTLQKIEAKEARAALQLATSQSEDDSDDMSVYGCEVIVTSSCSAIMGDVYDVESDGTVSPGVESDATVSPVADGYCTDEDLLEDCSIDHEFEEIVT